MICYAKISVNGSTEQVVDLFDEFAVSPEQIILDSSLAPKGINGVFTNIKTRLLNCNDSLIIDSINSLGKNGREIAKELQWFIENDIALIIVDIPSTHNNPDAIKTLYELYSNMALTEIRNVKEQQQVGIARARANNTTLGRKRIPYPDNWEKYYLLWKQKKISATEFMKATGLKKGTLYNLIKQYKEQETCVKEA